ncbi:hypothetical protein CY35_06G092900 [Sphagnum magellanicum]|nr:hypothetical protein CY35_06G092900 [Sphagnum magellanicum]
MAVGPTNKSWVKEKGGEQRRQGFLQKGFRTRGGMGKCMLAMHKCATAFGSRPWAEELHAWWKIGSVCNMHPTLPIPHKTNSHQGLSLVLPISKPSQRWFLLSDVRSAVSKHV